jgi:hypothetical protein
VVIVSINNQLMIFQNFLDVLFWLCKGKGCRSQWPYGQRSRSSAARLLRLWVWIPPGAWMSLCFECCVLSGRCLCDGLINHLGESYRLWRVIVCDQEISKTRRLKPVTGLRNTNKMGCNARKTNNNKQGKGLGELFSFLICSRATYQWVAGNMLPAI